MNYIKGNFKILGVIGNPVEHSLSPLFQNYMIKNSRLAYVYIPFKVEVEGVFDFLNGIKKLENINGLNITIPFKEKCFSYAQKLSAEAKMTRAVNTFLIDKTKFYGFNTDVYGIIYSLKMKLNINSLKGKNIVLIGAGGAGRAFLYSASKMGAKSVFVVNRNKERFLKLKDWAKEELRVDLEYVSFKDITSIFSQISADLVINSTPLGLKGEKIELDFSKAKKDVKIFDMVYGIEESYLIKMAKKNNIDCVDGLPMLIAQGVKSFNIWTGISYDPELILSYVKRRIRKWQKY